ncbi:MAG TPA: hypothetical protein VFN44_06085 [Solirubrobacteraceae bacterium]|nr:hypothetical protein [Solirubrobacteraceae bacterium]
MSQISPPIRIVLVAAIGLIAAWMLFLRPKTEPTPAPAPAPATAPGVKGLSNAVDKAKDASATSDKANGKIQQATGGDDAAAAKPGKSGSKEGTAKALVTGRELPLEPLSAKQTKGLPKPIVKALDKRQVFVVGVFDTKEKRWAPMASDDRAVRRELTKANRYHGKVVVATSSLGKLSSLNAIIGDLGVSQTPSVVVVDRNRKAVVLTGYVERNAINQAIADARRNSTEVRITDPYVRSLNRTCANFDLRLNRFNLPTTRAAVKPTARRFGRLMSSYRTGFASLKAPAKYRPIQRQVDVVLARGEDFAVALRSGNFAKMDAAYTALLVSGSGLDRRFAAAGATTCVSNRKS